MKYMAIEQITRLESPFYVIESNARAEAEILTRQYGGEWIVEQVPDSFPVNEKRLLRNYKPKEIMAMIKGERKNLTPALSEWISVKDRLPETQNDVLVHYDFGFITTRGGNYVNGDDYGVSRFYITHWMPLPEPPVEESK